MTISFLPREHNMKAVNVLKTYSEKLVSSIFRERAFKNISLLIEFWYRNRERGRRKWERYAANRVVVKWVEKWVRSKAVNYRMGGNERLSHCAWNQSLASFWNIYTHVAPTTFTYVSRSKQRLYVSIRIWQLCEWRYD